MGGKPVARPMAPGPDRRWSDPPWVVAGAVTVGVFALIAALRPVARALFPVVGAPARWTIVAGLSLFGLGLVAVRGRWREAGLGGPGTWRDGRALVPLGIYTVLAVLGMLAGVTVTDPAEVGVVVVLVALIGLNEEVLFRGVLLDVLQEDGVPAGVVGSSVLFGLVHLNNLIYGADPAFVALQVVAAFGTGVFFCAVRVRTGTLVPLIVAHALTDLTPLLVRGPSFGRPGTRILDMVPFTIYSLVFAAVGLWMIRDRWQANP